MTTEELNEFVFADLVDQKAHNLWKQDAQKLLDQGLSVDDAIKQTPTKEMYIPKALESLNASRKCVFEALEESKKASGL